MKEMRRVLSFLLVLVMVLGMFPPTAFAEGTETVLDAAIFCSDVHGSTSDLTSVLEGVKTSGVDYSSIGFVGDTCLTVDTTTSTVQSALGDTNINVMFSYAASHDTEDSADINKNWDYSGEVKGVSSNYLVYTIRETDMQNTSDAATAAPAFTTWYNGLSAAKKALPIFIMSHRPLHKGRDDNNGAAAWYDVIEAAANTSDIVVFWGHNHTSETQGKTREADYAAYYVPNDGTESITVANGGTEYPNFTYMNAGYINANGQRPKRIRVATTVQITASNLIFQDYTTTGAYTDASYSHNVTVAREHAVYPTQLIVSGTNEYTVGENYVAPTVYVQYSDGSKVETTDYTVTLNGAEVTGVDTSVAGTYVLTYKCTVDGFEATTEFTITVKEAETPETTTPTTVPEETSAPETTVPETTGSTTPETPTVTGISVTAPTKTWYERNETLDTTGMVVTATYSDGTTATITEGYEVSAVDMTTSGEKTVTVTYEGYTATFTVTVNPNTVSCEAGYMSDGTLVLNNDTMSATGNGLTGMSAVWNDTVEKNLADANTFGVGVYKPYDVSLEGYTAGEEVTITMVVYGITAEDLVVYYVEEDGTLTEVTVTSAETTEVDEYDSYTTLTFTTNRVGTFVVGNPVAADVPADATLARVEIVKLPDVLEYFIIPDATDSETLYLDITGLEINAIYSDGTDEYEKPLEWDKFKPDENDGYGLAMSQSMTEAGVNTITVSYQDATPATFTVTVYQEYFTDESSNVTVQIQDFYEAELTVTPNSDAEFVANAMAELEVTNYASYDIDLSGHTTGQNVVVTLPIPENVTDPAVFYVPEDGSDPVELTFEVNDDGTVSFTTDHFSTYVVGDNTLVGEDTDAVVPGTTEVWKLTSDITAGTYLIVNTNQAGEGYALLNNGGSISAVAVTVENDGTNTYIELDNANAEWTLSANASNASYWDVKNGTYYLGHSGAWYSGYELTLDGTSESWSSNGTNLYFTFDFIGTQYRYLTYSDNTWTLADSSANVYFYAPATADKNYSMTVKIGDTEYTTSHEHTVYVDPNETLTVDFAITPDPGTSGSWEISYNNTAVATVTDAPNNAKNTATVTFTGSSGTVLIQAVYTHGEYVVKNYITITAIESSYAVEINDMGDTYTQTSVETKPTLDLAATVKQDGAEMSGQTVTWNSSDSSVATVDGNGVVTFTGEEGDVTITVTYTNGAKTATDSVVITAKKTTYSMDIKVDGKVVDEHTVTGVTASTTLPLSAVAYSDPEGYAPTFNEEGGSWAMTSSDETVATIEKTNGVVSFKGVEGSTTITATYSWTDANGDTQSITDSIVLKAIPPVYGFSITDSATQLKMGTAYTFVATPTADGTALTGQTITWSSSDADIAHVHETSGVVTGMAVGTANITATWTDPNGTVHTDTVEVVIQDAVYALELHEPTYTLATAYVEDTTYFVLQDDGTYIADTSVTADTFDATKHYTQSTQEITAPIIIKNVNPGDAYQDVWAVIYADGVDLGKLTDEQLTKLTYISNNTNIATVDKTTGHITFQGGTGTVTITCMYEYADGKYVTDAVVFSVSADSDYVPEDGTNDFPEYPNEGAIRFDKTATAVGNFSQTGIVQVELSMTGVPYTTGSEIDVVVMLDMTGSMSNNGMEAAEEATKAFVEKIVKNEDGTYNNNRVAVYAFNSGSSSPYELVALQSIADDDALTTVNSAIDTASDKQASGGTPFDEAAKKCYDVLQAAKTDGIGDERKQFCVFMSDGGPTTYYGSDEKTYYGGNNNSGDVKLTSVMTGYSSSTSSDWVFSVPTEYYTDAMKADGVTVYTVGLLLQTAPSNPAPYSSMTDSTYNSTTDSLTTIGSHYFFTSSILKQMASDESKYIDIFNVDNADKATAAFTNIAMSIKEAAKDVKVTDKMADEFTMVFEAPNTTVSGELPSGQEFYMEVKDYALTPVYTKAENLTAFQSGVTYYTLSGTTYTKATSYTEGTTYYTITDYTRGTATSLMKIYLGTNTDGSYYAASDASGTAHATPTFNQTAVGTMFYWTTNDISSEEDYSGVSVKVSNTTYYFDPNGMSNEDSNWSSVSASWYNMASGAYASGTKTPYYGKVESPVAANISTYYVKDTNGTYSSAANTTFDASKEYYICSTTSTDLIIATPYFVYNADTKILVWTAEKLNSSELALSYFLYLDKSGGWAGAEGEVTADTYDTNEYAYLNYTNFNDRPCEQEFPVPKITWNGAQVSYVFYLVNEKGQPVNRAGRVVPFSEAVYVTDVFTYAVVWNDEEQVASLEAEYLATELVPNVYKLYDADATYDILVYEDEKGDNLNNHFIIGGTTNTTYVFNTKADATKYTVPATYAAAETYWHKLYAKDSADVVVKDDNSVEYKGTLTYYKNEDGTLWYSADDQGAYIIVQDTGATAVQTGFDFSNTTVAFAVVWVPQLVEDVVVIDFGLDVVIDVTTNDALASGVVGIRTTAPSDVVINKGTYTAAKALTTDIMIDKLKVGTASVENLTSVRFSLDKTNGMQLSEPVTFYYESDVNYYNDDNALTNTSMYSSVTVIPATTVYYEDEYVSLSTVTTVYTQVESPVVGNVYYKLQVDKSYARYRCTDSAEVLYEITGYTTTAGWDTNSVTATATQDADRPGESRISADMDADNVYGYDSAYSEMSTHSMGSAAMINVKTGKSAKAEFTFYGTGFDIISMTDSTTGTIFVDVYKVTTVDNEEVQTEVKSLIVDTYYGYTYTNGSWVASNSDNAIYQVPVINVAGLEYAKYRVEITASYAASFDHNTTDSGYNFYLDAIRIYDPTGVASGAVENSDVSKAYKDDGEGWPVYQELRNNIIAASDFKDDSMNAVVFIDGISENASVADFVSYGPNNEVYLAAGQAIAFNLDLPYKTVASVQLGIKSATGEAVEYLICDGSELDAKTDLTDATGTEIKTATDMYYDITDLVYDLEDEEPASKNTVVVIYNSGDSGIISLTNIKITFTAKTDVADLFYVDYDAIQAMLDNLQKVTAEDQEFENDDTVIEGGSEETEFDPAIAVNHPATVYAGAKYTVTVTTDESVTAVTVKETNATYDDENQVWTAEVTAGTTAEEEIEVIVSNGTNTKTATATAKVVLDADLSVELPEYVKTGETYKVTITANSSVKAITVNDTAATYDKVKNIWTCSITAGEEAGYQTLRIVAYNTEDKTGAASDPLYINVTVKEFEPDVTVSASETSVSVGNYVTITVTTSADVASVTVDGKLVTTYTTDTNGKRIWKYDVQTSADDANTTKNVAVVVYDADGRSYTDDSMNVAITVTEASTSVSESISNIIRDIFKTIRGWFGW